MMSSLDDSGCVVVFVQSGGRLGRIIVECSQQRRSNNELGQLSTKSSLCVNEMEIINGRRRGVQVFSCTGGSAMVESDFVEVLGTRYGRRKAEGGKGRNQSFAHLGRKEGLAGSKRFSLATSIFSSTVASNFPFWSCPSPHYYSHQRCIMRHPHHVPTCM